MSRDSPDSPNNTLLPANNKRFSKIVAIEFDDNDDVEEKKAQNRRKSVMLELGLTTNNKNKPYDNSKAMTLTSEQITNHYGDCMKLSSENKITPKNAFDLYLIDYLQDHLKRLQSFQVLSSSLDAGAKIYAGRVDSVHSNTYNIMTRCDNSTEDDKIEDVLPDDIAENVDTNIEMKIRRPKKRIDINKKFTCTNIKKIRLTASQIRSEVDPLFQSQSKKYDEGGTSELRLNNLKILDANYELLLDFESVVSTKSSDCDDIRHSDKLFDVSDFGTMFKDLSYGQIHISSEFDNFKFTGWDRNNDNTTSQVAESLKNMILKEESEIEYNNNYYDNDEGGDYGDFSGSKDEEPMITACEDNNIDNVENINAENVEDSKNKIEDDLLQISISKYENETSLFVSSVKEMVNSFMENYGVINDSVLGMWAGPDHWKQKAKPVKIITTNLDIPKVDKQKKPKKELLPMFEEYVETRYNNDGIGRLVNITKCDNTEQSTKTAKQLTDECINKNMKKEYLLPPKSTFVLKSLNQLMNRDISLVNKALKTQTEQIGNVHLDKDQLPSLGVYNDNEEVAVVGDDMIVVDADGNINEDDNYGDEDNYYDDDDPYTGRSLANCDFDDFGEQLPLRTVESQDINYAKTAKKINVKKLKCDIKTYLTEQIHIQDIVTIDKTKSNLQKSNDFCNLSDLLVYVDEKSAPEVSRELSVSILMTCLLHLANETGLDIISKDDYADFTLGQGFSEYDVEQVKLFGEQCVIGGHGDMADSMSDSD